MANQKFNWLQLTLLIGGKSKTFSTIILPVNSKKCKKKLSFLTISRNTEGPIVLKALRTMLIEV